MDIPISKITKDFLTYIRALEELNINVASEFILMAATLMKIKSKLLLPRTASVDDENDSDPRLDLSRRLIEYQRFKSLIPEFETMREWRSTLQSRGNSKTELLRIANQSLADSELESLTLINLFNAFERALRSLNARKTQPGHLVVHFNYAIDDQKSVIRSTIMKHTIVSFDSLFVNMENRIHAIITFLSLLEMINDSEVEIKTGHDPNSFVLSMAPNPA